MGLSGIGQIAITVDDLSRAARFYSEALGMRTLFEAPGMVFLECGGTRVLLGTENSSKQAVLLYFTVADIIATHEQLCKAGVEFSQHPTMVADLGDREVWLATFHDPAGNIHNLISETPRGGAAAHHPK